MSEPSDARDRAARGRSGSVREPAVTSQSALIFRGFAIGALAALALYGQGCNSDNEPARTIAAGSASLVSEDGGQTVSLWDGNTLKLQFPADGFELGFVDTLSDLNSYDPYWLEYTQDGSVAPPNPNVDFRSPTSYSTVQSGNALTVKLQYNGAAMDVAFESVENGSFKATLTISQPSGTGTDGTSGVGYVRLRPRTTNDPTEGFYGLGELEDAVDNRGKLRAMQLEPDGAIESAYNEAHVPIPLVIGTDGWGVFVEDKRVGLFDVARKDPALVEITYGTGLTMPSGLVFHLYSEANPLDIEKHYYSDTVYPALPAPWALGPFIWRNSSTGETEFRSDVAMMRSLHLATSAVWIDNPYASHIGSFDFDPTKYTDPIGMIKAANDLGLRVGLWHVPYVEAASTTYRGEIETAGYFPLQNGILFQNWSPPIDFTASGATPFWQNALKTYVNAGIEGFKLDYGEDVVPALLFDRNTWVFHDGSDERTMHYQYTRDYHDAYKGALPAASFLLCRAGRWGDQGSATILWPGDMDSSFTNHGDNFTAIDGTAVVGGVGGLPATIIQGLSLSVSGFPLFASDTGGYRHAPPDNELYIRWFEQTSLAVVMEVGDGSSEQPWEFTAQNGRTQATLDLYKQYTTLHMQLFPYAWTLAQNLATTGRPIIRPVGFQFPSLGVHPGDEYMFGDDLLVAPVIVRGATNRTVVFPPGEWIDWWDGTLYEGPVTASVPAPLEKLPLFVRATGAIPMLRPTIESLTPVADPTAVDSMATDAGVLSIRLAPRPTAETALDLYDGTHLDTTTVLPTTTINLKAGSVYAKGYLLELVTTSAPASITADGSALTAAASLTALNAANSGYFVAPDVGGTVWIKVPATSASVVVTAN